VLAQTPANLEFKPMTDEIKPLPFDLKAINGLSAKNLVSHNENNYIRAVKGLNAIGVQLAELDYVKAPVFMINGLKRKQLIATNSMICMRPISRVLPVMANHAGCWPARSRVTSAVSTDGGPNSPPSARPRGRFRLGDPRLLVCRSYDDFGRWAAGARPRHVEAKAASDVDATMEVIRWDNAAKLYERSASRRLHCNNDGGWEFPGAAWALRARSHSRSRQGRKQCPITIWSPFGKAFRSVSVARDIDARRTPW
jgi:superoxide dismutase, Fe-Mn family